MVTLGPSLLGVRTVIVTVTVRGGHGVETVSVASALSILQGPLLPSGVSWLSSQHRGVQLWQDRIVVACPAQPCSVAGSFGQLSAWKPHSVRKKRSAGWPCHCGGQLSPRHSQVIACPSGAGSLKQARYLPLGTSKAHCLLILEAHGFAR